jgi:hypothetical protein
MPGSPTTPGHMSARASAPIRIAFHTCDSVGPRNTSFAAPWLAYALPYRRFARTLAGACARLGADAVRYSFTVVDFHHLLLAGFTGAPHARVFDHAGSSGRSRCRVRGCCLPQGQRCRHPDCISFAAQWLAYAHPYRRFAIPGARLGADVVRYSFIVVDFHHLLLAGLSGALTLRFRTKMLQCPRSAASCHVQTLWPPSRNVCPRRQRT